MNLIRVIKKVREKLWFEIGKIRATKAIFSDKKSQPIRNASFAIENHSSSKVKNYYEEMTDAYMKGFGEVFQGSRPESTEELLEYILDAADLQDGMNVLDAGCGVCGPAIWLANHKNIHIEALTISETQVAEATKRIINSNLESKINVKQGDFHRLGEIYPHNHFDRILFLETLCHAENYRQVLEQAKLLLKPGGCLYIKDFYCVDNRSKPHLIDGQYKDLISLNELYCLAIPDLPSTVDLLCEFGFVILYMRQPTYIYTPEPWLNFEKSAGKGWNLVSELPDLVIKSVEFYCQKG